MLVHESTRYLRRSIMETNPGLFVVLPAKFERFPNRIEFDSTPTASNVHHVVTLPHGQSPPAGWSHSRLQRSLCAFQFPSQCRSFSMALCKGRPHEIRNDLEDCTNSCNRVLILCDTYFADRRYRLAFIKLQVLDEERGTPWVCALCWFFRSLASLRVLP